MTDETHILVFPFPVQGHINPMIQFAKRLASKRGLKVTFIVTSSIRKTIQVQPESSIRIVYIHDGFVEGEKMEDIDEYIQRFKVAVTKSLPQFLVGKLHSNSNSNETSSHPRVVVIYDSVMPWALDIVHGLGLRGAAFFTQSSTVSAVFYHYHEGHFKIPLQDLEKLSLPAMPELENSDLPSFMSDVGSYPHLFNLITSQSSNFQRADWVFFNTFDELEKEIVRWMQNQWRIKTIGPTIPSLYLDKRLDNDNHYGINLFKPNADSCLKWLEKREKASVVYVSFGSLASLSEAQMKELAWGLKDSNCDFLWVVRDTEKSKLPNEFMNQTSEKGLVVNWCPQLEVLSHQSVGCFMTHCGWNSTIEALSLGVPMVAMPQWTDQATNAKCIADVWRVGVRVQANANGSITREEIKRSIKEVLMDGGRGSEIRRNALRWKELAHEAVDEGGSSDKNIDQFILEISWS